MITNIFDNKDTSFLSINKALSNKIKLSLLKNGVFLYFEQHFHKFLERCSILKYNNIVCCPKNNCQDIFCKNHCTLIYFLWFTKVKYVKSSSFLTFVESTSSLFYRLTHKCLM
jgi:hypothetical protein